METAKNENSESKPVNGVEKITRADICELRNFQSPNPKVLETLLAVAILLDEDQKDWKKMLADASFLKRLKIFNIDNVAPAKLEKLKPYVENPDFTHENVACFHCACGYMVDWVREIYTHASHQ